MYESYSVIKEQKIKTLKIQITISRANKNNKKSRDIKQLVSLFLMERSEK